MVEYFETATTPTWEKSYIYTGSRLLSTITNTGGNQVTEYHHPDRLGTRLISNPTTATQNEQLTLPFGTLIGAETSATNDKRFTSYDRSEIAGGLDYAVNRNYNSGQSRFTQVDPIGMDSASIGDPQSLNMFAYVQNNPIDFTDPSGLLMAMPNIGRFIVTIQISWWERQWDDYWGADNGWGGFGGDTGRRTPRDPGEPGGGNSGSGSAPTPPPDNNCGLNPITKEPGILNDKPSKANPAKNPQGTGRVGARGNIRAGNGGLGGFKERSGDGHNGIDIASPVNQLVFASLDGVVERSNQVKGLGKTAKERGGASQNYGWGGLVVINYNGMALNGAYAHLSHVYVKEGDIVKAGDLIGLTGRTGNANNPSQPSGDDHLHYGRFTGEYTGGSLGGKLWIDPQRSLNSKCPPKPKT